MREFTSFNNFRTWFTSKIILNEHKDFDIRQTYLWFVTADNYIVIVGNEDRYQFPGGKPETSESIEETLNREAFEEVGLILKNYPQQPELFGYYLIEEDKSYDLKPYLQLRYFIKVDEVHSNIKLSANERIEDKDKMSHAKFVELNNLPEFVPWIENKDEYIVVKKLNADAS